MSGIGSSTGDFGLRALQTLQRSYFRVKNSTLLHEILGRKFAFVVLRPRYSRTVFSYQDFVDNNLVLICRPVHNAKFLEALIRKYAELTAPDFTKTSQYGNHIIQRVMLNGKMISFVRTDGLFVFAADESRLRSCLDTFDGERPSLQSIAEFDKLRSLSQNATRFLFLQLEAIRKIVTSQLELVEFRGKSLVEKELQTTRGFNGLGYAVWNRKNMVESKIIATFDHEKIHPVAGKYLRVAPRVSSMHTFTSRNPMVYYWSNTFDPGHLLDYFLENEIGPTPDSGIQGQLERVTGKKATEIISMLGNQLSVVVEPGRKDSNLDLPLFLFTWKTRDKTALRHALEAVIHHYGIPTGREKYGSVAYNYWSRAPEDGAFPLYGFRDDYFFFGNSLSLLKSVIDNSGAHTTLAQQKEVKSVDPGFSLGNNSVTYTDNRKLFKLARGFLDFLSTLITLEDKDTAGRFRALVDEVVNPLLEGAAMYEKKGTRSYFAKDMVIIESKTSLAKQKTGDEKL